VHNADVALNSSMRTVTVINKKHKISIAEMFIERESAVRKKNLNFF